MGVETEFAFAGLDDTGTRLGREECVLELLNRVRDSRPHLIGRCVSDLYLTNGSRLYLDCGGHPEFSTPECATPRDIVRYVRAGEEILYRAAQDLEGMATELARAYVFKCNVDYLNVGATWGSHESYLYQNTSQATLARELIPHLVSRVVYTGAGGLNPKAAGIEFTLSPRVAYLERDISSGSTSLRGIYHTKDETLASGGYHRLHVLSGESLYSHVAEYLRVGTTALIVKLIESGHRPGEEVGLVAPLVAMGVYVADAACVARAPIVGDCMATAVEIQRHYLEEVERKLDCAFMPEWAGPVCCKWREVLDALERDPGSLVSVLDWPTKLAVFQGHTRRHGVMWDSLPTWSRPLQRLQEGLGKRKRPFLDSVMAGALFRPGVLTPDEAQSLWDEVRAEGVSIADGMDRILTLRHELCEIDTRFGQLGPDGIFATLERAGVLNHRMVSVEEIQSAIDDAPSTGRARVRGQHVRELALRATDYSCNWRRIVDTERRRVLDLSDPWGEDAQWRDARSEMTERCW